MSCEQIYTQSLQLLPDAFLKTHANPGSTHLALTGDGPDADDRKVPDILVKAVATVMYPTKEGKTFDPNEHRQNTAQILSTLVLNIISSSHPEDDETTFASTQRRIITEMVQEAINKTATLPFDSPLRENSFFQLAMQVLETYVAKPIEQRGYLFFGSFVDEKRTERMNTSYKNICTAYEKQQVEKAIKAQKEAEDAKEAKEQAEKKKIENDKKKAEAAARKAAKEEAARLAARETLSDATKEHHRE